MNFLQATAAPDFRRRPLAAFTVMAMSLAAFTACFSGGKLSSEGAGNEAGTGNSGGNTGGPSGGSPDLSQSGLPCPVATLVANQCASCHGSPLKQDATMPLLTRADFTKMNDGVSVGADCVARMEDADAPMPPGGLLDAASVSIIRDWVEAGMPEGNCDTIEDPFDAEPICTSGETWIPVYENPEEGELEGSSTMAPGQACITCHVQEGADALVAAGTIYPSAHEPDDCKAPDSKGAVVILTDANGDEHQRTANSVGNFNFKSLDSIAKPFKARVEFEGRVRAMNGELTSGDCNKCHTQTGASDAPGRILLP